MERSVAYPTFGESVKKVFYGVGKAVESQSPRAWNERIIRTINEKVIPKLTPEQLQFVAKHQKAIEGGVRGVAVAIPTLEIVAASIITEKAVRKVIRIVDRVRLNKALEKKYPYKPTSFIDVPVKWATDPKSQSPTLDVWVPAAFSYAEKYGVNEGYFRFGDIMTAMQMDIANGKLRGEFQRIYKDMQRTDGVPQGGLLKQFFLRTFDRVADKKRWFEPTSTRKQLMRAYAEMLYDKWKNTEFAGVEQMIAQSFPDKKRPFIKIGKVVDAFVQPISDFDRVYAPSKNMPMEDIHPNQFAIRPPVQIVREIRKQEKKRRKSIGRMKARIHEIADRTPDGILYYKKRVNGVRKRQGMQGMSGESDALEKVIDMIDKRTEKAHRGNPTVAQILKSHDYAEERKLLRKKQYDKMKKEHRVKKKKEYAHARLLQKIANVKERIATEEVYQARERSEEAVMIRIRNEIAAAAGQTADNVNPVRSDQQQAIGGWLGNLMHYWNRADIRQGVHQVYEMPTDTRDEQLAAANAAAEIFQKVAPKGFQEKSTFFPRALQWIVMGKPGLNEVVGYIVNQRLKR